MKSDEPIRWAKVSNKEQEKRKLSQAYVLWSTSFPALQLENKGNMADNLQSAGTIMASCRRVAPHPAAAGNHTSY